VAVGIFVAVSIGVSVEGGMGVSVGTGGFVGVGGDWGSGTEVVDAPHAERIIAVMAMRNKYFFILSPNHV